MFWLVEGYNSHLMWHRNYHHVDQYSVDVEVVGTEKVALINDPDKEQVVVGTFMDFPVWQMLLNLFLQLLAN